MHKDAKIYVAGHRGLVGSALVKNLMSRGYHNIVSRSHSQLDLTDTAAVAQFFATEKPQYVFLAAAKVGGIVANTNYRAEFIHENLMIQNNVIHQSYLHQVQKMLFLGSTCIYPKNCPQPMQEDYLLTDTLEYTNEPYAIAKIAGIKMCESYNLQYGTNFISVMPTNLYGPNDNFDLEKSHVLPALIRKIHLGKALEQQDWKAIDNDLDRLPIEGVDGSRKEQEKRSILKKYGISQAPSGEVGVGIWGSGAPKREFLWSEDMADACVFIMENINFMDTYPKHSTEVRNTHINIGTGQEISIAELAEDIKTKLGFQGKLIFDDTKPDGTMRKLTDVSKLNALGWKHKITLGQGIEKIYKWYNENQ
ncbi:GDP-L-fucose synthase family protein [Maribacter sp. 2307ULW6-5]|uniref:GDP-L-fucose synthase family protein n=1 Tax=Maribacter sp. 2307ULW6-5 TaxID=3386275 RepID=UPI0039BC2BF2